MFEKNFKMEDNLKNFKMEEDLKKFKVEISDQNFSTIIFFQQISFYPKKIPAQIWFHLKNFWPKFFWSNKISTPNFFDPKNEIIVFEEEQFQFQSKFNQQQNQILSTKMNLTNNKINLKPNLSNNKINLKSRLWH